MVTNEVRNTLPGEEERSKQVNKGKADSRTVETDDWARYEAKSSGKITWVRNETGEVWEPGDITVGSIVDQ